MEETRKDFINILQEEYANYCKARGEKETISGYSEYMINRNIITDKTVNRFVIISKYPIALSTNLGIKKMAIYSIQDTVNLSFGAIRNVLNDYAEYFRLKKRLIG
jgi:hypothetical protein